MFQFKVSVFMLTYNQENYIAQAIESILMQKTNFDYQLVIGEDCSTDDTLIICENYLAKYPDKIKLISQAKNKGLIQNFIETSKLLRGKYVAICDGDDYWIDEFKLQKQVNFLEQNRDYTIVYARTRRLYPDGTCILLDIGINQFGDKTFNDLVLKNFIPSVTAMIKNPFLKEQLPNWFKFFPYGDWPSYLLATVNGGKIKFLNEIVAVYRMNIGESFKLSNQLSNLHIENLKILNSIYKDKRFLIKKDVVFASILHCNENLMMAYNREGKIVKGFSKFIYLLKYSGLPLSFCKKYCYSIYLYFYKKL